MIGPSHSLDLDPGLGLGLDPILGLHRGRCLAVHHVPGLDLDLDPGPHRDAPGADPIVVREKGETLLRDFKRGNPGTTRTR